MMPKTYFSAPLSKSARDTEGRIRNIFEGERRRPAVLVLALVAAAALLCGSMVSVRGRASTAVGDEWEQAVKESAERALSQPVETPTALPRYEYQGGDPYLAAVCEWSVKRGEQARYHEAQVTIPCPLIADVDDSDPQDIRVWGNFWSFSYTPRATTLFCVSGGENPGLLHLRAADSGYAVFDAEMVGDGEAYGKDMRRIFGVARMLKLDALDRETVRAQYLADYVLQNDLPFTQYQDYGWNPVHIPGTPETPESAQRVRYADPAGWSIDYDLREFSLHSFDENETGLSGVGDLEGISINFERYSGTTTEAVIAVRAEQMEQPTQMAAALGGIGATLLRDGATRGDVVKDTYVLALNETDTLAVTVRNTYYAVQGDPVVPGADAALAKTLATFGLTQRSTEELALEFVDRDGFLNALQKAKSIRYTTPRIRSDNYPIAITDEELLADLKGRLSLVKEATEVAPHVENDGEGFYLDESNVLFCVCEGYLFALRQYPDGNSVSALIGEAPEYLPYDLYIAAHKQDAISNDTRLSFAGEVTGYGNDTLLVQVTDAKGSNLRVGEKVYVPVAEGYENYPRGTEVEAEYNGVVEMDDEGLLGLDKVYSLRRIG